MDLVFGVRRVVLYARARARHLVLSLKTQVLALSLPLVVLQLPHLHDRNFEERFQRLILYLQRHILDCLLRKALGSSPRLPNWNYLWL
jgi:hypothetical protein